MSKFFRKLVGISVFTGIGLVAYNISLRIRTMKLQYENCIIGKNKTIDFEGEEFKGAAYGIAFSDVVIDLRGSELKEDATLEVFGEFSHIELLVPRDWEVIEEGERYRSNFENQLDYYEIDSTKPTLYIQYHIRYSCLEIE